jgi:carbamoylphosphate synthase large subunit|tara:strand:- start:51 stop:218 length:168 start_codon:yes stop_codon:yes gene_type:complete
MAIGRNFQEAMQKAIRMATPGVAGFEPLALGASGIGEFDDEEKMRCAIIHQGFKL